MTWSNPTSMSGVKCSWSRSIEPQLPQVLSGHSVSKPRPVSHHIPPAPCFTLDSLDAFTQTMRRLATPDHPPPLYLDSKHPIEELHRSRTTVVYRAWPDIQRSTLLGLRSDNPEPLVFKLVSSSTGGAVESLEHEYTIYQRLLDLQGTRVPKCWGLFYGLQNDDQSRVGCLVLEDCGDKISSPTVESMPYKLRFVYRLVARVLTEVS